MTMKTKRSVILLATHKINDFIISQYYSIQRGIDKDTDVILLLEDNELELSLLPVDIKYYIFSVETLNLLKYNPIQETIIPGSNHFPVLQFYREHGDYAYYWNIEYDVYFNGNWSVFFKEFESLKTDFISSHVETYDSRQDWGWWYSLKFKTVSIERTSWVKSFNPVYRISNAALSCLDNVLSAGNSGHHECLIATVLSNNRFSINDLGGCGAFTPESLVNKFYQSYKGIDDFYRKSTMRYRPVFSREDIKKLAEDNMIYHPVK